MLRAILILTLLSNVSLFSEDTYDDNKPMLGVQMTPTSTRVQQQNNLNPNEGVYVFKVYDGTAADKMGIKPGDVITHINGEKITSMSDLRRVVEASKVGEEANVQVARKGERLEMGGASFRPWPESIPYRDIDSAAERRYREMQRRRLGRQLDRLDDLTKQADAISREIAKLAERDADAKPSQPVFDMLTGTDPVIPAMLRKLPGWQFTYGLQVASPESAEARALPVSPAAANAPQFDLRYRAIASSEAL